MVKDTDGVCLNESSFYYMWRTEFPDVVIPHKQRLGKCPICEDLHAAILDERSKVQRMVLKSERQNHINETKEERLVYHEWRWRARKEPAKYMCVILDGMDQAKTIGRILVFIM